MKSKSFNLTSEKQNSKTDFVGLYKSVADTNTILSNLKLDATQQNEKIYSESLKREFSPNKKKKKHKKQPVDLAQINIDGSNFNTKSGHSTPVNKSKNVQSSNQVPAVKSIMKNNLTMNSDDNLDDTTSPTACRRKKRNKSVSFMLEDEETVIKKTKSEDSVDSPKISASILINKKGSKLKNLTKKKSQAEKENKVNIYNVESPLNEHVQKNYKTSDKQKISIEPEISGMKSQADKIKKIKKDKKDKKTTDNSEVTENESTNNEQLNENKEKKRKKKKRKVKSVQATDTTETEGEPKIKTTKKDEKPEVIVKNLENLSIGDNANTLTCLLDEMTVVDKDKKKKIKQKNKKAKKHKKPMTSTSSSEAVDLEKIDEGREKVIWRKRKWNKDKKGGENENLLHTSIIVENLPLSMLFTYKKLLTEHFSNCGAIKRIGIAELYPLEESKPVFTTTVVFESEDAAMKALEEDNSTLQGARILVKWPRPPTETTLVVRSFAEMSDQNLSSMFVSAGKIRHIKQIIKGKKSMATAFIEFDGPEAVARAINMAEDVKIGGKKVHVSRFEQRTKKKSWIKTNSRPESENEGDSEDSND